MGDPPDNLRPLPSKNIDTGMGLERTASVLQGVESNFHIDILRPLVEAAGEVCGVRYQPADENGRRLRRIADHLRACAFAVHENVYPGNKKQGYVIALPRGARRAPDGRPRASCKAGGPRGRAYESPIPSLQTVATVAGVEKEGNFLATIDAGWTASSHLRSDATAAGVSPGPKPPACPDPRLPAQLFEPRRRTQPRLRQGFREMEQHGIESGGGQKVELFRHDPLEALKALHGSRFLGYETLDVDDAKVIGIIASDQLCDHIDEVDHEHPIVVVLDKTPFYGEMGGQVGDMGEIVGPGFHFEVIDAHVDGAFTLHRGHLREGRIELGTTAAARVDPERRQGIRRAHSATHLLHYALQKHLGKHALQQGSKVDDDLLRFDFANPSAVTSDGLARIETR